MDEKETKLEEELKENAPEGSEDEKEPEVNEETEEPKEEETSEKTGENVEGESEGGASDNSKSTKKKSKHDKKQDAMKEKVDELEDRVKRQLAEFENFRNRTEKEKQQMFETGARSVIEKILPIVDNFERGLATVPEEDKGSPFAEGMEKIYKQLMTELEKMEVKPIEAVGTEFNPDFHNAVMQVESEEYETGTVAQELQKGYTYRDQVVRHSMVAVVQ